MLKSQKVGKGGFMKEQNLIKNENYITIQGFMINE